MGLQRRVRSRSWGLCTFPELRLQTDAFLLSRLTIRANEHSRLHTLSVLREAARRGTHCWSPHAAPRLRDRTAGFGLDDLWGQRWRGDVLPCPGLDGHLIGHLESLSQREDDLVGLGLGTWAQETLKLVGTQGLNQQLPFLLERISVRTENNLCELGPRVGVEV